MKQRFAILGVGLFAAGIAVGVASSAWLWQPGQVAVGRGDTLVSMLPDEIMSLSYTTLRGTTVAQRSAPGARFAVQATYADGRPLQRCMAAPDLAGHLTEFSALTARRGLSTQEREREFPVQLGLLEIRDRVMGEPNRPVLVFANPQRTSVAVVLDDYAAEVQQPPTVFAWLEKGCASLEESRRDDGKAARFGAR